MKAKFVFEGIDLLKSKTDKEVAEDFDSWVKAQGDNISSYHEMLPIPEGYEFNNKGTINFAFLKTLPPNVKFNNGKWIDLSGLLGVTRGTKFNNGGPVDLQKAAAIGQDVEFNNKGYVTIGVENYGHPIDKSVIFNNEGNVNFLNWMGYKPNITFTDNVLDVFGVDDDGQEKLLWPKT